MYASPAAVHMSIASVKMELNGDCVDAPDTGFAATIYKRDPANDEKKY